MPKNALVSFVYHDAIKYFDSLIDCVNSQTMKEFDFIIFNDGVIDIEGKFNKLMVPIKIINVKSKSLTEIRFKALKILLNLEYDSYIFQDCDDLMSRNRIAESLFLLKSYDLVVNDLDLIDENSNLIQTKVWSDRFEDSNIFNYSHIEEFNFVGLGNSSINRRLLKFIPVLPMEDLKAIDWYIFYSILRKSKKQGHFTSECCTKYRQHENNTIGIQYNLNIQEILRIKKQQKRLVGLSTDLFYIDSSDCKLPEYQIHKYPFWWELKYINNENN